MICTKHNTCKSVIRDSRHDKRNAVSSLKAEDLSSALRFPVFIQSRIVLFTCNVAHVVQCVLRPIAVMLRQTADSRARAFTGVRCSILFEV